MVVIVVSVTITCDAQRKNYCIHISVRSCMFSISPPDGCIVIVYMSIL